METSWQNITRRLDINQVSRDTTYDKTRGKGRNITKVGWNFVVPAYTVAYSTIGPRIIVQYDYTAPSAFRILNYPTIAMTSTQLYRYSVAIRYREGTTSHRWRLTKFDTSAANQGYPSTESLCSQGHPQYAGERILPNFTVEVWINFGTDMPPFAFPKGLPVDITLQTNLLKLPDSVNDVGSELPLLTTYTNFGAAFPENYPMSYPAGTEGPDNI
jgi:hypothetical protein